MEKKIRVTEKKKQLCKFDNLGPFLVKTTLDFDMAPFQMTLEFLILEIF